MRAPACDGEFDWFAERDSPVNRRWSGASGHSVFLMGPQPHDALCLGGLVFPSRPFDPSPQTHGSQPRANRQNAVAHCSARPATSFGRVARVVCHRGPSPRCCRPLCQRQVVGGRCSLARSSRIGSTLSNPVSLSTSPGRTQSDIPHWQ